MSFAEECYKIIEPKRQQYIKDKERKEKERKEKGIISLKNQIKELMKNFNSDDLKISIDQKDLCVDLSIDEIEKALISFGFKDVVIYEKETSEYDDDDFEENSDGYHSYEIEFTVPQS